MTLRAVLQSFLTEMEWEDEITERDGDHFVDTGYKVDAQSCRLQIITDEKNQLLRIYLRSPIAVPNDRRVVAAVTLNALNLRMSVGALHMDDDEGAIFFSWALDVEDCSPSTTQFTNMLRAAGAAFDSARTAAIGAAAYTQVSSKRILAEYLSRVEELNSMNADGES